jgi:hypothetical protein
MSDTFPIADQIHLVFQNGGGRFISKRTATGHGKRLIQGPQITMLREWEIEKRGIGFMMNE